MIPKLQDLTHEHLAPERHRHRLPSILPSASRPIAATAHHPRNAPAPAPHPNPLIYPTDFGADPTGRTDSTEAFRAAMAALLSRNQTIGRNMSSSHDVACADMGGATLHLGGGDYLISEPIYIPCHVCNMRVHGGTLRASPSFPANSSYMIESGWGCAGVDNAGSPEFIGFSELLLDCRGYAAGGLHLLTHLGANVGPRIFVTGFSMHGINIQVGHEVGTTACSPCRRRCSLGLTPYEIPRSAAGDGARGLGLPVARLGRGARRRQAVEPLQRNSGQRHLRHPGVGCRPLPHQRYRVRVGDGDGGRRRGRGRRQQ